MQSQKNDTLVWALFAVNLFAEILVIGDPYTIFGISGVKYCFIICSAHELKDRENIMPLCLQLYRHCWASAFVDQKTHQAIAATSGIKAVLSSERVANSKQACISSWVMP